MSGLWHGLAGNTDNLPHGFHACLLSTGCSVPPGATEKVKGKVSVYLITVIIKGATKVKQFLPLALSVQCVKKYCSLVKSSLTPVKGRK